MFFAHSKAVLIRVGISLAGVAFALCARAVRAESSPASAAEQMDRGNRIFSEKCVLCHQAAGLGVPSVYPPLAGSDFLQRDRSRAIRILCEGLSGRITVRGTAYENVMPAQVLDDQQVADVLTFVGNSWGNQMDRFDAEEVAAERQQTQFPTFKILEQATAYQPLPKPPEGWTVREVAKLPNFCVRLATNGSGKVYALGQEGTVYFLDEKVGALLPLLKPEDYLDEPRSDYTALGMTQAEDGALWFVINRKIDAPGEKLKQNEISIFRTVGQEAGHPASPKLWFRTHYHYGIGGYNHGVSTLAFGPDGMLYLNSGSRTDGGEPGPDDHYYKGGEVDLTASIWRLDPRAKNPAVEIFARGIRNAFGFAWDGENRFFAVVNGPDVSAPEPMYCVEQGKHYGFPFQFSNWPIQPHFPYAHTPPPPPGAEFTLPVANVGPAAGGNRDRPLYTFDPHSSPAGMIWCGAASFPPPFQNGFLITRFGNLLGPPAAPEDVGFDLLWCQLEPQSGGWQARVSTVLAPLGRPIDIVAPESGRILILEYTRPTNFKDKLGWLPGRITELARRP